MIAPMKKVWLVLLESDKASSLKELRRLGLVHLEPVAGVGQEFEEAGRRLAEVEKAIGLLSSIKAPTSPAAPAASGASAGFEAAHRTMELAERLRQYQEEASSLSKELERVASWGDFDPSLARDIGEKGFSVRLFECSPQALPSLADRNYVRLGAPKGRARIALVEREAGPGLSGEFQEFALSTLAPVELRNRIAAAKEASGQVENELAALTASLPALRAALKSQIQDHEFERVRSGIEAEGPLTYLSGFIPATELPKLTEAASRHSWGLLSRDPEDDELPPSKVENGPFVRIVQPVFDFLGTTPGYREYDISAWFLIFFCVFFAMIFGDGGYGAIMLAIGGALALKSKAAGKKVPDFIRLLLLLAGSTVAYGAVTGTWFAIPPERLPGILGSLMVPFVAGDNPASTENIKIICFILGAVQISLAHIKNIIRDFPNPKFLAQLGWLSAVLGLYFLVLNLVLDAVKYPVPTFALYMIGAGFLLVFAFGNWDGNLGKSLLGGLGGLLTQFLGTVSALADIISYIRLFAVGLAGVAIAQTFNAMGGGLMHGLIGTLLGLVILVFGHALNLMMSALSVVVHGVRLNMLEFSGHLGMEWSGYKYDPFKVVVETDNAN